jgi:uncharacterized membrane-anchored protein YjiN (DUF445 family)
MKRNAKHTASISLGIMGAGFAAAFPIAHLPYGFVLQSGFEAGVVGGLADWFAVTALFRHPMGIPIPHTGLLPKNRDKVTDALVNAIQSNLLHKESIIEKLKAARVAERVLQKGLEALDADTAGERISMVLQQALPQLSPEAVAAILTPALREAIRSADTSTLLERLSRAVLDRQYEEPLFDYIVSQGEQFAASPDMRRRMGAMALKSLENIQFGGFMGFAVNAFTGFMSEDKLGGLLQDFLISVLYDMHEPGNEYRETALESMRTALNGLPANEAVLQEIERLQQRLAEDEELEHIIVLLLRQALLVLRDRAADPVYCGQTIVPVIRKAMMTLTERPERVARIDEWIQEQAASWMERNHGMIGNLVKENAEKLDNDTLVAMMEKHVGKDLQWIRVNGAVCGFAIGIVLGTVQWFAVGG